MSAGLVEFVRDLAEAGLRFSLNPCHDMSSQESSERFWHDHMRRADESIRERAKAALSAREGAGEDEPAAWMFQHDETGRMTTLENDGVNNPENFVKNNPRFHLIGPLYRRPAPTPPAVGQGEAKPVAWVEVADSYAGPYSFHGMERLPPGKHHLYTTPPASPALPNVEDEDEAEAAYWRFDARHKGYAEWSGRPQSERDAFKAEHRALLARLEVCEAERDDQAEEFARRLASYAASNQSACEVPDAVCEQAISEARKAANRMDVDGSLGTLLHSLGNVLHRMQQQRAALRRRAPEAAESCQHSTNVYCAACREER